MRPLSWAPHVSCAWQRDALNIDSTVHKDDNKVDKPTYYSHVLFNQFIAPLGDKILVVLIRSAGL